MRFEKEENSYMEYGRDDDEAHSHKAHTAKPMEVKLHPMVTH